MKSELSFLLEEGCNAVISTSRYMKDNFDLSLCSDVYHDSAPCCFEIDKKVEEVLKLKLAPVRVPVFSAEQASAVFSKNSELNLPYWMINSDSTLLEEVNQKGEFSISLALMRDSTKLLSIVLMPVEDRLYLEHPGKGWFVIDNYSEITFSISIDIIRGIAKPIAEIFDSANQGQDGEGCNSHHWF